MSTPTILAGRCELLRSIGPGSSGEVFEARDLVLGATLALKRSTEWSAHTLLDIKAEFRALSQLHVPGLVQLYDLVVLPDMAFFTMELVRGQSFTDYARAANREDVPAGPAPYPRRD